MASAASSSRVTVRTRSLPVAEMKEEARGLASPSFERGVAQRRAGSRWGGFDTTGEVSVAVERQAAATANQAVWSCRSTRSKASSSGSTIRSDPSTRCWRFDTSRATVLPQVPS